MPACLGRLGRGDIGVRPRVRRGRGVRLGLRPRVGLGRGLCIGRRPLLSACSGIGLRTPARLGRARRSGVRFSTRGLLGSRVHFRCSALLRPRRGFRLGVRACVGGRACLLFRCSPRAGRIEGRRVGFHARERFRAREGVLRQPRLGERVRLLLGLRTKTRRDRDAVLGLGERPGALARFDFALGIRPRRFGRASLQLQARTGRRGRILLGPRADRRRLPRLRFGTQPGFRLARGGRLRLDSRPRLPDESLLGLGMDLLDAGELVLEPRPLRLRSADCGIERLADVQRLERPRLGARALFRFLDRRLLCVQQRLGQCLRARVGARPGVRRRAGASFSRGARERDLRGARFRMHARFGLFEQPRLGLIERRFGRRGDARLGDGVERGARTRLIESTVRFGSGVERKPEIGGFLRSHCNLRRQAIRRPLPRVKTGRQGLEW